MGLQTVKPLKKRTAVKKRYKKFIRHQSDRYVKVTVCMYYYYNVISYIIPGAVICYQDALLVFYANIFFLVELGCNFFQNSFQNN